MAKINLDRVSKKTICNVSNDKIQYKSQRNIFRECFQEKLAKITSAKDKAKSLFIGYIKGKRTHLMAMVAFSTEPSKQSGR